MNRGPLIALSKHGRVVFLDFEFNNTTSEKVNLVSVVTFDFSKSETKKFFLHNNRKLKKEFKKYIKTFQVIVGYSNVAEARSFYSLGFDPLKFKWIDLFLEYRMISNHNDKINWGSQLVDGKIKFVKKPKPKYERTEEDAKTGFRPTHSLAEATYKLTGEIRDTIEKDECRDLILSDPKSFTKEEQKRILRYNAEDVESLPSIFEAITLELEELSAEIDWDEYIEEALWRGRYAAHTALMESHGYPINVEATKNFSNKIPSILAECQADINSQFKDSFFPFKWHAKNNIYSWNQKATREWLEKNGYVEKWMRTDKDQLSLSLEAFEKYFSFRHDYPRNNFGAQMVRYLKLKQSLFGFAISKTGKKKKTFWDAVGPDGRARPYMNIYGAQSGRSQPGSTGFMFLKPAWMRALVEPSPGHYLCGIDYGQQEFFLSALLSEDPNMIQAYLTGDPYLYGAKQAGAIPKDGTKKTHARERDLFKATYLGILYNMTKYGLSYKLTADTGEEKTEEDAQVLIDTFEELYPIFTEWRKQVYRDYEDGYAVKTLDGWVLWCDNDNFRSVTNVPAQGGGASIMRKAVDIAVSKGVKIIFTLHDAIYFEAKEDQLDHIKILNDAMREGFAFYFKGTKYFETAKQIKLDPKAWGPQFPEKGEIKVKEIVVPVSKLHIDSRALGDYEKFSKFFSKSEVEFL